MSYFKLRFLTIILLTLFVQAFLMWIPGGAYFNTHEGDVWHALDGALRMAGGEKPHLDFMTPLGVLSFAPIAVLISFGLSDGYALQFSNVLIAVGMLPFILWAGMTRLKGLMAMFWGAGLIILLTASFFGAEASFNSFSMYYNRWCWSALAIALTLVVIPPKTGKNEIVDGVGIGAMLAFTVLCKVTFFPWVLPGIVVTLLLRKARKTLVTALVTGLVIAAAVTVWGGISFWVAYVSDLLFVQSTGFGAKNGGWDAFFATPLVSASIFALLAAVVILRRAGDDYLSIAILVIAPGLYAASSFNWWNEPKFLLFFALVFMTDLVPPEVRTKLMAIAFIFIGMLAAPITNITMSTARIVGVDKSEYVSFTRREMPTGIWFPEERAIEPEIIHSNQMEPVTVVDVDGVEHVFENCKIRLGMLNSQFLAADDFAALALVGDTSLISADTLNPHWIRGAGTHAPAGAAVWYYGGTYGLESATHIAVPNCPASPTRRQDMLDALDELGIQLEFVAEGETAKFFALIR